VSKLVQRGTEGVTKIPRVIGADIPPPSGWGPQSLPSRFLGGSAPRQDQVTKKLPASECRKFGLGILTVVLWLRWLVADAAAGTRFTVVTYNVENYILASTETRKEKPVAARAKVAQFLIKIHPDVLALQEIGSLEALEELKAALSKGGVHLGYSEFVGGWDTNIHVAVLSRFPILARRSHTNDSFLLDGRQFRVSRGTAEVDLQVDSGYQFTLLTTHLKSKRPIAEAEESEIREQEAMILRRRVETILGQNSNARLLVCGDFNDTKDSRPIRLLMATGRNSLWDTHPAEQNGDNYGTSESQPFPRRIVWTHYYGKEDSYSRIDYILLSRGMVRDWDRDASYVFAAPDWGLASDHRPVVCQFAPATK